MVGGLSSAVFCRYLSKNRVWKNPRRAFKRARKELHNETNDHIHWQIFGGRYCETRRFFTSCLFYSLPYSLLCKCIEFPLPTILPSYSEQENLTKYSLSSQVLMFGSILPISLQQFEYDKIHVVHSNELAWDSLIIVVKNGRYSQNVGKISNNKKKKSIFLFQN